MNEVFDSWEGFMQAGFMGTSLCELNLTQRRGGCRVRRTACGLVLSCKVLDDHGGVVHSAESTFPSCVTTMQYWAALVAKRCFKSRDVFEKICPEPGDDWPKDLTELLQYGFDNMDELEDVPDDGHAASENGEDDDEGSRRKDVSENAFASMKRLVQVELTSAWKDSHDATASHDLPKANAALARIKILTNLLGNIGEIEDEWNALGLPPFVVTDGGGKIGGEGKPDPGDKHSDKPEDPPPPPPKGVLNFTVTFPDGELIRNDFASDTFAQSIEKLGPERVASLGLEISADPLVTQNRSEIKKMPQMVKAIPGGWFVKTHSNTDRKIEFLQTIADALQVDLGIDRFYRELSEKKHKSRHHQKKKQREPNRFKIGRVAKHYFPMVFELGRIGANEVAFLLSDESKHKFGTRGYPVLRKLADTFEDATTKGPPRYYSGLVLDFKGEKYQLTSQFSTGNADSLLSWLESKGFDRADMMKVGMGESVEPSLFDHAGIASRGHDL